MTDRTNQLPLVPLRDMVVFPSMMAPFVVGRRASILALEATLATTEKKIFLATQRDPKVDDPNMAEIHNVGVIATVVQNLKMPNQNVKVMVEGITRAEIVGSEEAEGYTIVNVREIDTTVELTPELSQYMQKLVEVFEQYAKMSHHLAFEGVMSTLKLDDPDRFADTLASHMLITTPEKQQLLETTSSYERLQKIQDFLEIEIEHDLRIVKRTLFSRRTEVLYHRLHFGDMLRRRQRGAGHDLTGLEEIIAAPQRDAGSALGEGRSKDKKTKGKK